jgi:hypothetical protein
MDGSEVPLRAHIRRQWRKEYSGGVRAMERREIPAALVAGGVRILFLESEWRLSYTVSL